jgi:hypothetical protein
MTIHVCKLKDEFQRWFIGNYLNEMRVVFCLSLSSYRSWDYSNSWKQPFIPCMCHRIDRPSIVNLDERLNTFHARSSLARLHSLPTWMCHLSMSMSSEWRSTLRIVMYSNRRCCLDISCTSIEIYPSVSMSLDIVCILLFLVFVRIESSTTTSHDIRMLIFVRNSFF